jgi:RHS repeat-associated protein
MRKDGTLTFMLSDQLGSTSVTTDSSGQNPTTLEYDPWGGTRFASKDGNGNDNTPTNYRYTGQRQEPSFGLYFYQARWYDPATGRFAQADTVIPGGVQGYDRYAYVNNSPVINTDPTGHHCADEDSNGLCPEDPGYDGGSGSGSSGSNPPTPTSVPSVNLPVKPITQDNGSSCGPATITMAYNYAHPNAPIEQQKLISTFSSYPNPNQPWYVEFDPNHIYTSPDNMVNIARYETGTGYSTGQVTNEGEGLSRLANELLSGHPVIIDVTTVMGDTASGTHFVVVTVMSSDSNNGNTAIIKFNNPLSGLNEPSNWNNVWKSWNGNSDPNGQGWWLVISP